MTGTSNICIGRLCDNAVTSGSSNVGLGAVAMQLVQDGSQNVGLGTEALQNNVSGNNNVCVGTRCLEDTTSSNNAALGDNALQKVTSGDFNTGLGAKAGITSVAGNATTTGDAQTYIGYQSGPSNATLLFNATAIGYNATVGISSAMVLGGTGTDAIKVAIGTTTPTTTLTVYGVVTSSTAVPTISCDAGTGVMTAESTSQHGEFVAGAAAVDCTITFAAAYPKKPKCSSNDETHFRLIRLVPTTTTLQFISTATLSSDTIQYDCHGAP